VWEVLDRFGRELQASAEPAQQMLLLLQGVRELTGADIVFFEPGGERSAFQVIGSPVAGQDWCRQLAQRVLLASPGGGDEVLHPDWQRTGSTMAGDPHAVAMVRISRERPAWVVALSFAASRPLGAAQLGPMTLARRLFLNHARHCRTQDKLKETLFGLVRCLTEALDAKDAYTCGHSERVGRIGARLAQQLKLSDAFVSDVYLAGLLHDIGKIGIRDSVLQKPGTLTEEEFAHICDHTVIGDRIVSAIKSLEHLRCGVRNHHEHYDGSGYPDGLSGTDIPLLARILAVADAFDAMMADRPYRCALPPGRIDAILKEGAGRQWDPALVEQFLACRGELYSICQRGLGESVIRAVEQSVGAEGVAVGKPLILPA
jgi:HD-GYP domain-containing protein (c-di-GMP phosphodiesterase class II)